MSTITPAGIHPALRGFPGAVLELSLGDGTVTESNGRLEAELPGCRVVGAPLDRVLDAASGRKLRTLLDRLAAPPEGPPEPSAAWELMIEACDQLQPRAFFPVPDAAGGRVWLVEAPRDPRLQRLYEELASVNSEQANTQRQLAKEKARLARALDELERELGQNDRLSRTLQAQNEEMEAQNEELLAMTEELHAGQEQLMMTNHQLERRTRELQVAMSARNRFYAAMSHELRTPINAVMGYNDLLLASIYGPLNEQQELAVERAQRAARHLRELVNDVLDISRLEAGKVELEVEDVALRAVVHEVLDTMRPVAEAAGCELRVLDGGGPAVVETDPRRLTQILLNLLSNAVKFGAGAPVFVNLGPLPQGGAVVEVVDGGPGIPEDEQAKIFEEFVQLGRDENLAPLRRGTGLGLSIARRLASALGGRLELSSTQGVGSTFRLILPPRPPRAARA
ncbi:MAG TPA: ATP-binding protein [Longimicrobium sp.]|nr:ATP-binding protein [Longimicrobium sp.]